MNEYTIDQIEVGMSEKFSKTVTKEMEDGFRLITGDENPLHQDDLYAKEISDGGFKGHVSFGMLTASLLSTLAGVYLPGKYSLIHSIEDISFKKPVYVGDELTVTGEVTDKNVDLKLIMIKVDVKKQDNSTVCKAKMKVLVMK